MAYRVVIAVWKVQFIVLFFSKLRWAKPARLQMPACSTITTSWKICRIWVRVPLHPSRSQPMLQKDPWWRKCWRQLCSICTLMIVSSGWLLGSNLELLKLATMNLTASKYKHCAADVMEQLTLSRTVPYQCVVTKYQFCICHSTLLARRIQLYQVSREKSKISFLVN